MAMWKVISFLRHREGSTAQEFTEYWREVHAPLVLSQSAMAQYLRRYVQNYAIGQSRDGGPAEGTNAELSHDGVEELWFSNASDMKAAMAEPTCREALSGDLARFVDLTQSISWVAEVVPILDPGPSKVKAILAGQRHPQFTRAQCQEYWQYNHATLAPTVPDFWGYIKRYMQNHGRASDDIALATTVREYDMCGDIGFDSLEAMQAAFNTAGYFAVIQPDEMKLGSPVDPLSLITREAVLYDSSR